MSIRKNKFEELQKRMENLSIQENDLIEKFILGSGKGGQKLQKTASCVYLKHKPTGIEVKCQKSRSREMNRFVARRAICEKLEAQQNLKESERKKEQDKIRKQKKRRSRRLKEKILEDKKRRSEKKELRQSPEVE